MRFRVISLCLYFINEYKEAISSIHYNTQENSATRATKYSPKLVDKTCLLIPEYGPCRGNIEMYYYDPPEVNCSTFVWGGCQGNGNRFDTYEECIGQCLRKPNEPAQRPKWCALSYDYGFCFGAAPRWYYDNLWHVCKQTIYSGCGGNKNNFYSQEECESICLYAHGPLRSKSKKYGEQRKVLIVDSVNATTKQSRSNKEEKETVTEKKPLTGRPGAPGAGPGEPAAAGVPGY